jgi:tetratricopeptide (TPR) repeat protein
MKYLIIALTLGLTGLAPAQNANDYYARGEAALKAGNIENAKAAYQAALKLEPNHGNAKFRLLSMRNLSATARLKARKSQLASIVLPNVTFENLSLEESLEALGFMIEKASQDSFVPNFIIDDPGQDISKNNVNIRLRNIPASAALNYVLSQAKARVVWDAHVISVRPLNAPAKVKASSSKAE